MTHTQSRTDFQREFSDLIYAIQRFDRVARGERRADLTIREALKITREDITFWARANDDPNRKGKADPDAWARFTQAA